MFNRPYLHNVQPPLFWEEMYLFALSLTVGVAIILLARMFPRILAPKKHLNAVQAAHLTPTPRLGGVAIFAALILSIALSDSGVTERYTLLLLATSLLFAVGFLEDLGFGISARMRLAAAFGSSALVTILIGVWLPRADIPGLDALLPYWFIGIPITLFVTAGVANAFNLIDGVHGLACMTAIFAAIALAIIAKNADLNGISHLNLMLAFCIAGVFVLNFPWGIIFLGDAGAYVSGFALSWLGIAILTNSADVTPWAILLVVFWPVADAMLAIFRRSRRNHATMAPDRMHAHQLVMRALELRGYRRTVANPLTTIILAPFIAFPAVLGVIFWNAPLMAFLSVLGCGIGFVAAYNLGIKLIMRLRIWQRALVSRQI
ncbi:MAG: glycosyltransferase [Roseinatronobacter sp.]|nr:glycosyltransferase [Roseinatronobacter sp.]